jgi:hypothetical protein
VDVVIIARISATRIVAVVLVLLDPQAFVVKGKTRAKLDQQQHHCKQEQHYRLTQ